MARATSRFILMAEFWRANVTYGNEEKGFGGKLERKRPFESPKVDGGDKVDVKEAGLKGVDWIGVASIQERQRAVVNAVMKLALYKTPGISWFAEEISACQAGSCSIWSVSQSVSQSLSTATTC